MMCQAFVPDLAVVYLILSLFSYLENKILLDWQCTYLTYVCFLTPLECDIVIVKEMFIDITGWGFWKRKFKEKV